MRAQVVSGRVHMSRTDEVGRLSFRAAVKSTDASKLHRWASQKIFRSRHILLSHNRFIDFAATEFRSLLEKQIAENSSG